MNTYEVLVIFKPSADMEGVDAMVNNFQTNLVEGNGGQVLDADRLGRKRLAYDIKKFKDGFISIFLLKLPADKVAAFRQACQYNDDVLRITLVRRDNVTVLKRSTFRSEEGREREERPSGGRFGGRGGRPGGGGRFPRNQHHNNQFEAPAATEASAAD